MPHQFQQQATSNSTSNCDDSEKDASHRNSNSENDNNNANNSSSSGNNLNSSNNNDICRDYLRNTCRRGINCKFSHPDSSSDVKRNDSSMLTFCHDFQNRECRRMNCKFIHCSKQDEEAYKASGKLPLGMNIGNPSTPNFNINNGNNFNKQNQNRNNFINNSTPNNLNSNNPNHYVDNGMPVCKDFIKGDCFRGVRCKFRHLPEKPFNTNNFFESGMDNVNKFGNDRPNRDNMYMMQRFPSNNQTKPMPNPMNSPLHRGGMFPMASNNLALDRRNSNMNLYEPDAKRRAFDSGYNTPTTFTFANNNTNSLCVSSALGHHNTIHSSHPNGAPTSNNDSSSTTAATAAVAAAAAAAAINEFNGSQVSSAATANTITRSMYSNINDNRYLLEENGALRRRIEELKQQVGDLMAANEFLLEQNAQLRSLAQVTPATTVPGQNTLHTVATTLHNAASALHTNAVQKPPSSVQSNNSSQPPPIPIGPPPSIATTDLRVAQHHHHLQQQQQNHQQQRAAAVAVVAAAAAAATSGAVSNMTGSNMTSVLPSVSNAAGLSAASSISALTTSTSTTLVSYPIMTAAIQHSLGHLTH